jgi:hypothetical protein
MCVYSPGEINSMQQMAPHNKTRRLPSGHQIESYTRHKGAPNLMQPAAMGRRGTSGTNVAATVETMSSVPKSEVCPRRAGPAFKSTAYSVVRPSHQKYIALPAWLAAHPRASSGREGSINEWGAAIVAKGGGSCCNFITGLNIPLKPGST